MSLCELISRFEDGEVSDADLDHPLTGNVAEELAQCKESASQRTLFSDARQLADHIIERYLVLDQTDKARMAEVYESEGCFKKIGGIRTSTRKMLQKKLGEENFLLLYRICNYSKIIPVLENYVQHIEGAERITPVMTRLVFYLRSHNLNGDVVKYSHSKSPGTFATFDFVSNQGFKYAGKKRVEENILESMLFGVDEVLRQRVLDAHSLLPVRKRILENYVGSIEGAERITPGIASLVAYLMSHNLNGDEVKTSSDESLHAFAHYNFVSNQGFRKEGKGATEENVLVSMLFSVDDVLRQRVLDAHSLLSVRKRILENYVQHIEGAEHIIPSRASLNYYLRSHNLNGDKVEYSSESLNAFTQHDFASNQGLGTAGKSACEENVWESMLFGVDDELRQRVLKARSLLPVRKRILENYVGSIEGAEHIIPSRASLNYYLRSHNLNGDKVEKYSVESLYRFAFHDFVLNKTFQYTGRRQTNGNTVLSMIHGVDNEELVAKVKKYNGVAA